MKQLPNHIFSGQYREGHVQGIAVDTERGFMYWSFTTILLKTDLEGNPLGSVERLAGHLGCITFDAELNRVYGSLELKHDSIGAGIIKRTGWDPSAEDSFYLVCFDLSKIDRMHMDAERDGVMRAVYLGEVADDYRSNDEASGREHRYGCSGIDGTALGPAFGEAANAPKKIMVAYGVYGDTAREDNDYQVILQLDRSVIDRYALPLDQAAPHHSGPDKAEKRYFFYTGNTRYGIQNLEYDPASRLWLAAVYVGSKEHFPNYPLFAIDGTKAPTREVLRGRGGEIGEVLYTAPLTHSEGEIHGARFSHGATGIASLGDGRFYISHHGTIVEESGKIQYSDTYLYRMDRNSEELFVLQA